MCFFDSCQAHRLEKKLDPDSSEFISITKYIMTSEEYKQFINLPAYEERSKFIEDFWKRRDPTPETEENEFKNTYLARIDAAKRIFGKGPAGDLDDRGMIYVLFGPPSDVLRSRRFIRGGFRIQEIWIYSVIMEKYQNVQVYFVNRFGSDTVVDGFGSGNFELEMGAPVFSLIQEAKTYYLEPASKRKPFKYDIRLKEGDKKGDNVELLIRIEVPYENIWFSKVEDKMEATLSLNLKILDDAKNKIWEHEQDYPLSIVEKEVEEFLKVSKKYVIEIPTTLSKGKYSLHVNLSNKTGEEEEKKVMPIKI
ncbi:MAG: GWxTD domain-containing protein [Candidatus Aminicenantes bacterium]|nr:GWxTD domain-containing protein [Candidatus Aminicenantes bacterium]